MKSLPLYSLTGKTDKTVDLDPTIFAVDPNPTLLHQAITAFLANRRTGIAHVKDRSAVAGSGKKPWKQKGTGNARAGSVRSPLWRGGGITFGPSNERNYSQRMPQKMRQGAWKVALSAKVQADSVLIIDNLDALDGKTKSWTKAMTALPLDKQSTLVVSNTLNTKADCSIRNIEKQKYVTLESLTLFDVARFGKVILTQDALTGLTARLTKAASPVKA